MNLNQGFTLTDWTIPVQNSSLEMGLQISEKIWASFDVLQEDSVLFLNMFGAFWTASNER